MSTMGPTYQPGEADGYAEPHGYGTDDYDLRVSVSSDPSWDKCGTNCAACWKTAHTGHDLAMRHGEQGLVSATCHDCDATYWNPEADR